MTQNRKVAIITGSSRGIGAAIATRLAKDGLAVVINYAGNAARAEELAATIRRDGGEALPVRADVSDAAAVATLFDAAEKAFGGVDVLVNNAGIMTLGRIVDVDDAAFTRQVDINFRGTFNTLRQAARQLRNDGRVVNLSTSVVGLKFENYGVYAATKAAVETLTAILARELRGRNITVNAVAPGPTATDLFLEGKSPELIQKLSAMSPLERLGTPVDIAAAVAFLVGSDGAWINGQTLRANGGIV
ncbi:SDR family oxidoreductase [Acetobacter oeni]|uniref:3-ketoacyl-ACP reductase n=1 Tax=Acetobacter oeni TaxID=304077 RepID=A0A511XQ88_9PROT|nr:SDR family oxidoreductase [Acetobacter oeni]MBB3884771.1 3-oxoacyl-[acyl-carrier protein] reductase [Acetobacter oeni]NHO20705.1 SDR family oxidoreductase [Acetobacter oeni]GBR06843.1 dehydrogenase [Acetobacter oeni LMG 21952]GEN65122.1 3-ketoacyl-ACP reductase [Acetobacter oeni]